MSFRDIRLPNKAPGGRYILSVLSLFTLSACTETFEIDFPEEPPQLVVYSLFHPDSVWQVSVSSTKDLNSPNTPYPVIDNATVEIYQGEQLVDELAFRGRLEPAIAIGLDGTRSDTVVWRRADEYRSERGIRPEVGVAYTLRVLAPGYPTATATGRIPAVPAVTIGETRYNQNEGVWPYDESVEISGVIRDVPEQNNFYMVGASVQEPKQEERADDGYDTIYVRTYVPATPLNIRTVGLRDFTLFSDQSFFGIAYPLRFRVGISEEFENAGVDSVTLHLGAIEEPFYRYYETLKAQD